MGLSLFASRQNALIFLVKHLKKTFQCKTCPVLLFASACRVGGSFFRVRGPLLFGISSPKLTEWFLHAEIACLAPLEEIWRQKSSQKSDPLWEFVKVIESKKCFTEFVFFLAEVSEGFRHERGEDKNCDGIIVEKNKVCERMWKRTHSAGGKKKSQKRSRNQHQKIFYSVISKIAFSVLSSFPPNSLALSHSGNVEKPEKRMFKNLFLKKKKHQPAQLCVQRRESKRILFEKRRGFFISFQFQFRSESCDVCCLRDCDCVRVIKLKFFFKNYIIISEK